LFNQLSPTVKKVVGIVFLPFSCAARYGAQKKKRLQVSISTIRGSSIQNLK
jgi:hypothetical protein